METTFELVYNTRVLLRTSKFFECLNQAKFLYNNKGYKHMKFTIREFADGSFVKEEEVDEGFLIIKTWNESTFSQKKKKISTFIGCNRLRFWYVCGKDRQKYFEHIDLTKDNIDKIRDSLYSEYIDKLEKSDVFDKDLKLAKAKKLLF